MASASLVRVCFSLFDYLVFTAVDSGEKKSLDSRVLSLSQCYNTVKSISVFNKIIVIN